MLGGRDLAPGKLGQTVCDALCDGHRDRGHLEQPQGPPPPGRVGEAAERAVNDALLPPPAPASGMGVQVGQHQEQVVRQLRAVDRPDIELHVPRTVVRAGPAHPYGKSVREPGGLPFLPVCDPPLAVVETIKEIREKSLRSPRPV